MTTAYSKVTTKAQTVIPREVRARLGLKAGDRLAYRITPEGVIIEKAQAEGDDPFATFTEWGGAADEQAFGKL
jgi:AbrB family looped-hinge helix DNA binding protein